MIKVILVTIAWLKEDVRIAEVPPTERNLNDIKLIIDEPQDGGSYKCELTSLLHSQRTYNVTGIITVQGKPTSCTFIASHPLCPILDTQAFIPRLKL
jgi:hypothetical protein